MRFRGIFCEEVLITEQFNDISHVENYIENAHDWDGNDSDLEFFYQESVNRISQEEDAKYNEPNHDNQVEVLVLNYVSPIAYKTDAEVRQDVYDLNHEQSPKPLNTMTLLLHVLAPHRRLACHQMTNVSFLLDWIITTTHTR